MFSRALLREQDYHKATFSVDHAGDSHEVAMFYEPIADAFLQLSEDGQSDFFHHVYEKLHEYETKPEPGMIAMSYEKSIEQLANNLYPEARAFITDLFIALTEKKMEKEDEVS